MLVDLDKINQWFLSVQEHEEFPEITDSDLTEDEVRWLLAATQQAAARKLGVPIESITVQKMMLQ